jgi:hypothetical protein
MIAYFFRHRSDATKSLFSLRCPAQSRLLASLFVVATWVAHSQAQLISFNTDTGKLGIRGTEATDNINLYGVSVPGKETPAGPFGWLLGVNLSDPPTFFYRVEVISNGKRLVELGLTQEEYKLIRGIEIDARGGNDVIEVRGIIRATVSIAGGEGNDTILVGRSDEYDITGEKVDVYGGNGDDTITVNGNRFTELHGGAGDDTIYGGSYQDNIFGEDDDDRIYGRDGTDKLFGGKGRDTIDGDRGANTLDPGQDGLSDIMIMDKGDNLFLIHMTWDPLWQVYTAEKETYINFEYSDVEYPIIVYHGGDKDTRGTGFFEPAPGNPKGTTGTHKNTIGYSTAWDDGASWQLPEQELFVSQELTGSDILDTYADAFDPYTSFFELSVLTIALQETELPVGIENAALMTQLSSISNTDEMLQEYGDDFLGCYLTTEEWEEKFYSDYLCIVMSYCGILDDTPAFSQVSEDSEWSLFLASGLFDTFRAEEDTSLNVQADSAVMLLDLAFGDPLIEGLLLFEAWKDPANSWRMMRN